MKINMQKFLINFFVSLIVGFAVFCIVTAGLQEAIYFSVFIGIPSGVIAMIIAFVFLNIQSNKI